MSGVVEGVERGESRTKATKDGDVSTHHFCGEVTNQGLSAHFLLLSFTPLHPQKGFSPVYASYIDDTPRRRRGCKKERRGKPTFL